MNPKTIFLKKVIDLVDEFPPAESIELLLNLLVKTYLLEFKNDKEVFMDCCSRMYDACEEQGNLLKFL